MHPINETNDNSFIIMKKNWKIMVILFLLGEVAFVQLHAQSNEAEGTQSNSAVSTPVVPATPPAPIHQADNGVKPEYVVRPTSYRHFSPHDLGNLLIPIVSVVVVFGAIV